MATGSGPGKIQPPTKPHEPICASGAGGGGRFTWPTVPAKFVGEFVPVPGACASEYWSDCTPSFGSEAAVKVTESMVPPKSGEPNVMTIEPAAFGSKNGASANV